MGDELPAPNGDPQGRQRDGGESNNQKKEISGEAQPVGGHKRSLSGSILSKLSFLRATQDLQDVDTQSLADNAEDSPASPPAAGGAMASVVQHKRTRKRKGSLRKTAFLGTARLKQEGRERRALNMEQVTMLQSDNNGTLATPGFGDSRPLANTALQGDLLASQHPLSVSSAAKSSHTTQSSALRNPTQSDDDLPLSSLLRSPTLGDASTTDEDEIETLPRIPAPNPTIPALKKPSSSGSDSYFPSSTNIPQRRRSSNKPKSPLAALPSEVIAPSEPWDYSETEWWGWVVLVVTWVVFVVGMGSCFGVWSWAWDVGETPYAPPELEDDPTLPIVGYYPALIILTTVMAWVWVVVAWVGMKYFKHAKIDIG
ncbi:hypothetical protein MMC12_000989 [Toensbergia leucococca]|nr:hypothetical protein [Toensbergia leucococca]